MNNYMRVFFLLALIVSIVFICLRTNVLHHIVDRTVAFESDNTLCRGTLYGSSKSRAGIVLAHGFGGTADCKSIVNAARAFAKAGFLALVFDYRYFGKSDGEPRQKLSVTAQLADFSNAVEFVLKYVKHIGVWGTSFSGGYTLFLARDYPSVPSNTARHLVCLQKRKATLVQFLLRCSCQVI